MEERKTLYKSSDLAVNFNKMRLKNKWCDVTINVNGKKIRAHKFVLAGNLKYFETMLCSGSFEESKDAVVNMESIKNADLMEAMIGFAYTGEFLITESTVFESLKLADYLCEDGIKNACSAFLEENMKEEEILSVFTLARAIGCASLKNAAKEKIVKHFSLYTQTSDYLNLDYEDMSDILSDGKTRPVKFQNEFFDGIMKWIIHDVQQRRDQLIDLLSFIDVAKFSSDKLIFFLFEEVVDRNDQYGIFKDVMYHYHASKIEKAKRPKVLVVVENEYHVLNVWFYDFTRKARSQLLQVPVENGQVCSQIVILHDKLYFILGSVFHVLDLTTKQYTTLNSSSNFEHDAAICANNNFVYLCGGMTFNISPSHELTALLSNQVLRYNIDTNIMSMIKPMKVKRSMAAAIFYQGYLLVIGGCNDSREKYNSVEKYEPDTKTWTVFPSLRERRHSHAVAILHEKLYVCGGYNTETVEAYDPSTNSWEFVASMNKRRSKFLLVAHEGRLLAMGQDGEMTAEVYDPSKNEWQIDNDLSRVLGNVDLRGGLVSASCVDGS